MDPYYLAKNARLAASQGATMTFTHILFDIADGIATITLNRPEARNALSSEMRVDLDKAMTEIRERAGDDVQAVILTGAGGAFCAGGDVKSMGSRLRSSTLARQALRDSHSNMYDLMNLEVPVVALVDGPAAGAGANIALAADFVLATPRAFLMQAFVKIGLVPDWGGMYILPRLVGLQRAKELVYTGRRVYADEAKEMGLVLEVVGQDTAMEEARAFAGRFVHAPTKAIGLAKNVMNQSYNLDHRTMLEMEAMAQSIARDTDFHKEAIRRFAAKEAPLYNWESFDKKAAE
jgi:2-(1,2-epoxy-1,2-dihydrophenyl)acetyl-CoA isomerase